MARKTTKPATKAAKNPTQKRAIDDNYVGPKKKPEPKPVTFAEALLEQAEAEGKTVEQVQAELKAAVPEPKAARPVGTSNLACTIRAHRSRYAVALHPNGKKTQNNGDAVAVALLRVPFEELRAFSATTFGKSFAHLNDGHARMCIGNLIRGAFRKDDPVICEWIGRRLAEAQAEADAE